MKNEESKREIQQLPEEHKQIEKESSEQKTVDSQDDTLSVESQKSSYVDYEEILRQQEFVPIRPLGRGAYGSVYEAYDQEYGIVAVKIIQKDKFDIRELEAAEIIHREAQDCPFFMDHFQQKPNKLYQILIEEYSNLNTLNLFAKQPQITLPSCILRALMKQILEGMRIFHRTGLVHRDIKCDNILLHCPPGTGRVYAKISDFGFAKKEDSKHEQTYAKGTLPYLSQENFLKKALITQKVDIYALGITFYNIIVHKYPVNYATFELQQKKMVQIQSIERPSQIKDDLLWNLLSQMLEFDPKKRISAEQALEHPYFTSHESLIDISKEQQDLAEEQQQLEKLKRYLSFQSQTFQNIRDMNYTSYSSNSSYIFPESEIKKFLPNENLHNKDQFQPFSNSQILTFSNQEKINEENENQKMDEKNHFQIQDSNKYQIEDNDQIQDQENGEIISITKQQSFEQDDIQKIDNFNQKCEQSSQSETEMEQFTDKDLTYNSTYETSMLSQTQQQTSSQKSQISQIYELSQNQQSQSSLSQQSIIYQDIQLPSIHYSRSIYSHHSHSIGDPTWKSQQFQASKEQLQAEKDLIEMKMSLEEIKEKFEKLESLSKLQIDVLCSILNKKLNDIYFKFENRKISIQIEMVNILLQILLKIPLQQIYPIYIHPLKSLINNYKKKELNQLLEMNIFYLINKLLNSKNEIILYNTVQLIQRISNKFYKDVEVGKPYPIRLMIENEGINKIFKIFKRKDIDKQLMDVAAYCIGNLFRLQEIPDIKMKKKIIQHLISIINDPLIENKENAILSLRCLALNAKNLTEIMKYVDLEKISNDFKNDVEGNEKKTKNIQNLQEINCMLLVAIIEDRKDDHLRQQILQSGIIESLLNIFIKRDIQSISQTYTELFYQLTHTSSNEIYLQLFNLNPYPSLLRLLQHEDIEIVFESIYSICIILISGLNTTPSTSQHPHFQVMNENDGINKIFKMFQRKDINKNSKDTAAECIGFLFSSQEIFNPQIKKEIILHLISIINDPKIENKINIVSPLGYLALNAENLTEIMKHVDLEKISNDFKNDVEGNENKTKNIQNQQEINCNLLTAIIKDRKDDLLRQQILQSGIVESLLNTFIKQDLQSISQSYTRLFNHLTYPSSDEICLQLFNLNPYPSLLRLLEHQDIDVVGFSIVSIFNILITGSDTTPSTSEHPHFQVMIENDGINKIFKMFQRKDINNNLKRIAAECIGFLFSSQEIFNPQIKKEIILHLISIINDPKIKNKINIVNTLGYLALNAENLTEIMKHVDLEKISNDLKKNPKGNDDEMKEISNLQQTNCILLTAIIKDRHDNLLRYQILQSGIVESLLNIFINRDLQSISQSYTRLFNHLTYPSSDEIKLQLFNLNSYPSLLRLLEHQDIDVVGFSIVSIFNILIAGSDTTPSTSEHPHFQVMIENDGINKIFKMFQRKDINNNLKRIAAECIGFLFSSQEIFNPQIKKEIILHLISIINDPKIKNKINIVNTLGYLALNAENLTEIMKHVDLEKISNDLKKNPKGNDDNLSISLRDYLASASMQAVQIFMSSGDSNSQKP